MQKNVMCIGVTGLAGSGKDKVANLLEILARGHDFRILRFSLSDVIRHELTKRGEVDNNGSRTALIRVGNEMREKEGQGVLAHRTIEKYSETETDSKGASLVIFSGIRTLGEIEAFRTQWGERFVLLGVLASHQVRTSRLVSREQYQEDTNHSVEVDQADQDIGILSCLQAADHKISNDGSLEQLEIKVATFFDHHVRSKLLQNTTEDEA